MDTPKISVCALRRTKDHYLFYFGKIRKRDAEPVQIIANAFQLAGIEPYVFGAINEGNGIYDKRVHPDYKSLGMLGVAEQAHLAELFWGIKDFFRESFSEKYELYHRKGEYCDVLGASQSLILSPKQTGNIIIPRFLFKKRADLSVYLITPQKFEEGLDSGLIRSISPD